MGPRGAEIVSQIVYTSGMTRWLACTLLLLTACGGAGLYGHARYYEPLDAEEEHLERASEVQYEALRRDPADYAAVEVGWFGVVTGVEEGRGGEALVHLTFRTLQPRNLCADESASSCRVTVSNRAMGPFSATLALRPEDRSGERRLWSGSLVKVYGRPTGDFDDEGGPLLESAWYRHWPRGTYVTTGASGTMRQ